MFKDAFRKLSEMKCEKERNSFYSLIIAYIFHTITRLIYFHHGYILRWNTIKIFNLFGWTCIYSRMVDLITILFIVLVTLHYFIEIKKVFIAESYSYWVYVISIALLLVHHVLLTCEQGREVFIKYIVMSCMLIANLNFVFKLKIARVSW